MKIIIKLMSLINKLYLHITNGWQDKYHGIFLLTRIIKDRTNTFDSKEVTVVKSYIKLTGKGNKIITNNNLIEKSEIVINGTSNTLILHKDIKLRSANIIIRGSNNSIEIGKGTTFGGVRMVNVGENNTIAIGEHCLFSDHIEIWASDTHSIYNEKNEKLNIEKPVIIGSNVWVGSRVIILKGIEIGEGAIIGMGTVVTKNVPSKTISVGSPNKVIKENIRWENEY